MAREHKLSLGRDIPARLAKSKKKVKVLFSHRIADVGDTTSLDATDKQLDPEFTIFLCFMYANLSGREEERTDGRVG